MLAAGAFRRGGQGGGPGLTHSSPPAGFTDRDDPAGGGHRAFLHEAGWSFRLPAYLEQHALDEAGDGHAGILRALFSHADRLSVEPERAQSSAWLGGWA